MDTKQRDRLAQLIQGIDITTADGRAGMKTLLREIESVAPGVLEGQVAGIPLERARHHTAR